MSLSGRPVLHTTVPMCVGRHPDWGEETCLDGNPYTQVFPEGTEVVIIKLPVPGDYSDKFLGEPGLLHPVGRPDIKINYLSHEVCEAGARKVLEKKEAARV